MSFAYKYKWWFCFFGLVLAGYSVFMSSNFFHDDAYITLRYAQRLIEGKGLTWNDGYKVEGFTNPLWLFQIAAMGKFGLNLVTAAKFLGIVYFCGILATLLWINCYPPLFVLIATLPPMTFWVLSGMESTSFIFWILLGLVSTYKYIELRNEDSVSKEMIWTQALIGLSLAAASLTRPEGLGVGFVVLVWIIRKKGFISIRHIGPIFLMPVLMYCALRYMYFGEFLPNTYYAKSYGIPWSYKLMSFVKYTLKWSVLWFPYFAFLMVLIFKQKAKINYWLLATALPICLAIITAGGGYMKGARLFVPVLIIFTMVVIFSAGEIAAYKSGVLSILFLLCLCWQVLATSVYWSASLPVTFGKKPGEFAAERGEPLGKYLEAKLPPGTLVAANSTGSISYFAPSISYLDMLGLSDKVIAKTPINKFSTNYQKKPGHNKGNGKYVLNRKPDVIILGLTGGTLGDQAGKMFLSDYELVSNEEFHYNYDAYCFHVPVTSEMGNKFHLNNDVNRTGRIVEGDIFKLYAYLRQDSLNNQKLFTVGEKLKAPWE